MCYAVVLCGWNIVDALTFFQPPVLPPALPPARPWWKLWGRDPVSEVPAIVADLRNVA